MRRNLPVTNNEYPLKDGLAIVSKTDTKGKITYVNPYFIEVSGFSEGELIGDSVAKVQAGNRLVEDATATMGEIVGSVRQVTDIMGEISVASQEQSQGIDQVNQAVAQMDQVT